MFASATDNVGVASIAIYLNEGALCSHPTGPLPCVWNVPAARNRTYTLRAKAADAAGNIGESTPITVMPR